MTGKEIYENAQFLSQAIANYFVSQEFGKNDGLTILSYAVATILKATEELDGTNDEVDVFCDHLKRAKASLKVNLKGQNDLN